LNKSIVENIIKNKLKATHFVRGIILGSEVKADIVLTKSDVHNKTKIEGDLIEPIKYGPINASVKASLNYLDNDESEEYNKEISVHSVPTMKVETNSVKEMFKKIEEIDDRVAEEKHFPKKSDQIIGVPIRFVLVPIKQFLDVEIEKLYLKLSDKILKEFNEFLVQISDIQVFGYIFKKVLKSNYSLAMILNNPQSELSIKIFEYEKILREIGSRYFQESTESLKLYKKREIDVEKLLDICNRFNNECNSIEILLKIEEFVKQGEGKI
jgi:hypothetical protein